MKSRLNLTIEDSLLQKAKFYADSQHTSVSGLVETYFEYITKPVNRKTFVDLVKELGEHSIDPNANLKEMYYKDKKHGG